MYVNRLSIFLNDLTNKMKALLLNKNALIFLFFCIAATIFWFVVVLDKVYETRVSIPISYRNVPVDIQILNDMPTHVDVKIRDKGVSLLVYKQTRFFDSLVFDFSRYTFVQNSMNVSTSSVFEKHIVDKISSTSVIQEYYPQTMDFRRIKLSKKRVPVKLLDNISYQTQYNLADDIVISPPEVTIYGAKEMLDTILFVYTEELKEDNLKDSLTVPVFLKAIPHTHIYPAKVSVFLPVEMFTESSLLVPVTVLNLPNNLTVRTIPSEVEVRFQVGKSKYNQLKASNFLLTVDYATIVKSTSRQQLITLEKFPAYVHNVKTNIMEVDCLIEIKE